MFRTISTAVPVEGRPLPANDGRADRSVYEWFWLRFDLA